MPDNTTLQREQLIALALDVRLRAYAPYSKFLVGTAILTESGKFFCGTNVENSSYGLTICAERVAATSAVSAGETKFREIAVASTGGHAPCGACRQFLAEFAENLTVLLVDADHPDKPPRAVAFDTLLPHGFKFPQ